MNIDELKDAWGKDEPKGMKLPDSTGIQHKTTSAVQRIRKNMRNEFVALLISYAVLIVYIVLMSIYGGPLSSFFFNMISILLFTVLILNCFYYSRFYVFYKSISRYDLNMRESIRKIAYELELNTEIYKTYNFCVTPLAILITVTLIFGKDAFDYIWRVLASTTFVSSGNLWIVLAVILISFLVTYVCLNIHVRQQYGKYLTELKQIIADLESDT